MKKQELSQITRKTVIVYLIIIIVVTLTEFNLVTKHQELFLFSRLLALVLPAICLPLYQKNPFSLGAHILMTISFLIYNCLGYYFRPMYIPSFLHTLYTMSFLFFMPLKVFTILSTIMTIVFTASMFYFNDTLLYNPGEIVASDLIIVPLIGLAISNLIYYFFTKQRLSAEKDELKFLTIGRLSARAIHDIKGALNTPMLWAEEIVKLTRTNKTDQIIEITENMNSNLNALKKYLISLNELSKLKTNSQEKFKISQSIDEAQLILKNRLQSTQIELVGECEIEGYKNIFNSILINLINNSLDHKDALKNQEPLKIKIEASRQQIIYCDQVSDNYENFLKKYNSSLINKMETSSGLGIYFIQEACELINAQVQFKTEKQLLYTIIRFNAG